MLAEITPEIGLGDEKSEVRLNGRVCPVAREIQRVSGDPGATVWSSHAKAHDVDFNIPDALSAWIIRYASGRNPASQTFCLEIPDPPVKADLPALLPKEQP